MSLVEAVHGRAAMAGHGELTEEGREGEQEEEKGGAAWGRHGEGLLWRNSWLLLCPWCSCGSCVLYVREGRKEERERRRKKKRKEKKRKKYEKKSKLEKF
jgi:hypothetical protein